MEGWETESKGSGEVITLTSATMLVMDLENSGLRVVPRHQNCGTIHATRGRNGGRY